MFPTLSLARRNPKKCIRCLPRVHRPFHDHSRVVGVPRSPQSLFKNITLINQDGEAREYVTPDLRVGQGFNTLGRAGHRPVGLVRLGSKSPNYHSPFDVNKPIDALSLLESFLGGELAFYVT